MNQLSLFDTPAALRAPRPDTAMLLAMDSGYSLGAATGEDQSAPLPVWRNGYALHGRFSAQTGDLQWLAKDYKDHSKGGRWYCYNGTDCIWECLDAFDQYDINVIKDSPPSLNKYGKFQIAEAISDGLQTL